MHGHSKKRDELDPAPCCLSCTLLTDLPLHKVLDPRCLPVHMHAHSLDFFHLNIAFYER